jgi:hypothetical protein
MLYESLGDTLILSAIQPRFATLTPPPVKFSAMRTKVVLPVVRFGEETPKPEKTWRQGLRPYGIALLVCLASLGSVDAFDVLVLGGPKVREKAAIVKCEKKGGTATDCATCIKQELGLDK